MTTPLPPCRLHVILARDAPVGVIFRRGPSKRVQLIHWDMSTDTFTPGQWFHGRIYEDRAQLSADGTLLMYDAMKVKPQTPHHEDYGDQWTAISKPPYLTALTLWATRTSSGRIRHADPEWHSHWEKANAPEPAHVSYREEWQPPQKWQDEFNAVKDARRAAVQEQIAAGSLTDMEWMASIGVIAGKLIFPADPTIHSKYDPIQRLMLVRQTLAGCPQRYKYSIQDDAGRENQLVGVEWADWDQRGRLVTAQDGKIFAPDAHALRQDPPRELIDLNGNTPTPMVAPDWAKQW